MQTAWCLDEFCHKTIACSPNIPKSTLCIERAETLTSVICSEHQLVQFQRHALVEIDLNPLGNRCNRAQYKLVHRVNMRPTMEPHSHPLSDPGVLLWHETLFSYSPKRRAVMLQPLPDYSCTAHKFAVSELRIITKWRHEHNSDTHRKTRKEYNAQMKITINWKIKEFVVCLFFVFPHDRHFHIHTEQISGRTLAKCAFCRTRSRKQSEHNNGYSGEKNT